MEHGNRGVSTLHVAFERVYIPKLGGIPFDFWDGGPIVIPMQCKHPISSYALLPVFLLALASWPGPISAMALASDPVILPVRTVAESSSTASPGSSGDSGFVFYNRAMIKATISRQRQVLLTFDDGPNPQTTPQILDILKSRNLKGIFFLVGMNVKKYPSIVKRIAEEGHTLGNHSYFHPNLRNFGPERIIKEIRDTNNLISQITGITPRLFRPPYGGLNGQVLNILKQEGMSAMLWTVDPRDWRNRNMAMIMKNLKSQLQLASGGTGGVILLHDTQHSTVAALEPFLDALAQQGLLPMPFGGEDRQSRRFWAMKAPVWNSIRGLSREWNCENIKAPLILSILHPGDRNELSSVNLLRARKSGDFYRYLLCRSY